MHNSMEVIRHFSSSLNLNLNPHKPSILVRPESASKLHPIPILHRCLESHRKRLISKCKLSNEDFLESDSKNRILIKSEEWKEKCKGRELVEALESLEEEAMKGDDDEGREPRDYNRRARIFDACSRVFQDLKERDTPDSRG